MNLKIPGFKSSKFYKSNVDFLNDFKSYHIANNKCAQIQKDLRRSLSKAHPYANGRPNIKINLHHLITY